MPIEPCPVIVRGGGDLGTGVIYRLHKSGFPVIVLELAQPLVVRRRVAMATAARPMRSLPGTRHGVPDPRPDTRIGSLSSHLLRSDAV